MAVLHDSEVVRSDEEIATDDRELDACQFCETQVTKRFRKVFGDNQDVAHRCIQCDTGTRLQQGSAAGRNVDHIDPNDEPWRIRNGHANRGGAF